MTAPDEPTPPPEIPPGMEVVYAAAADTSGPSRATWPALPEGFWLRRAHLSMIRDVARYHHAAPDAVLGCCLARAAVAENPVQPARVASRGARGEPTHAGLLVAVVGPAGAGKTTAVRVARSLVPSTDDSGAVWDLPVGSGEGVAEAFIGVVEEPPPPGEKKPVLVRRQTRWRALFMVDEGQRLLRLASRDGATLGDVLRSAFSGETIGEANAHVERRRRVEGYTLSLISCATPDVAAGLVAQHETGLPQRVLWVTAVDAAAPRSPAPASGRALPQLAGRYDFARELLEEMDDLAWRVRTGRVEVDPLDVHLVQVRCRVAAIMAGWDQRQTVTRDDWELAGEVITASRAVRDAALAAAEDVAREARARRARERGEVAQVCRVMSDAAGEAVERIAARLCRRVTRRGPASRRVLRDTCVASHERHLLDAAIDAGVRSGWLIEDAGGEIRPGAVTPSR